MKARIIATRPKSVARWLWEIVLLMPDDINDQVLHRTLRISSRWSFTSQAEAQSAARRVAKQLNLTVEE